MGCCEGICHTCKGIKTVILGVFVLLAWYLGWVNTSWWWAAVGVVVVLIGALHLVPMKCPHNSCCKEEAKAAAPKKRKR